MARLRRKDLKRDRFVEEVTHQVEYVTGHRRQFIGGGLALVLALAGGTGYWTYARQERIVSQAALQEAIELFHGVVAAESRPGVKTFATELERIDQVTRALDAVALDHAGTEAAAGAAYYSGLLDREQGHQAEAQSHFEQAVRGEGEEYPALARLALGGLLFAQGDAATARTHFEALAERPTRTISRDRARIEVARTFAASDPERAREILNEIQSGNGPASSLAASLMETLGEGS